jgi:hypothetical protein
MVNVTNTWNLSTHNGMNRYNFNLQILPEIFFTLRRAERDFIINIYRSSCKVFVIVRFSWNLNFLQDFRKCAYTKFNENPSSGSRVVPCGRTDLTMLIVTSWQFNESAWKRYIPAFSQNWYLSSMKQQFSYIFIHSVFCLTTSPKPLPKRFLHTVRSRVFSFKWEYHLLSVILPRRENWTFIMHWSKVVYCMCWNMESHRN